jgi:hypothetical protein
LIEDLSPKIKDISIPIHSKTLADFTISATNSKGEGSETSLTIDTRTSPSRPLIVNFSIDTDEITILWESADDDGGAELSGYNLYITDLETNLSEIIFLRSSQNSYKLKNFTFENAFFELTAINEIGESERSERSYYYSEENDNSDLVRIFILSIIGLMIISIFILYNKLKKSNNSP